MIHWLVTATNPRLPGWSEHHGWKLHAIDAPEKATFEQVRRVPALCGIRARYGWDGDLFLEDKCSKCEAQIRKHIDLN